MPEIKVLSVKELPEGSMKVVDAGETQVLLIHHNGVFSAVQPECPHAGAPLEEGALCNGRLTCPWHLATFALPDGALVEPPAMENLKSYPVRSDGQSIFVNPEAAEDLSKASVQAASQPVYFIAGAGAAGSIAAATLRQGGFRGRLVVVDPSKDEPVDRTQLSKDALAGKIPLDEIKLDVFSGLEVERVNSSVARLSACEKEVHLENGAVIQFDKALVATGGRPKRLQIPGAERAHTIRHSEDVRRILKAAEGKARAVIVGTSFIGLEAASALVQKGLSVTVAGPEKLPFAKQFGPEVAAILKKLHETGGTRFKLGVEIVKISQDAVILSEHGLETSIPADLVIMGVGVSPELGFDHDLPIDNDGGGIKTGHLLQAGEDVWVAGDIASVNGRRIEHWRVAQQHGRQAALEMLGRTSEGLGAPYFWTYHFDKRFGYLGHASEWDETFTKGKLDGDEFMVFYLKGGLVQAVLNCGFEKQMAALSEPMRDRLTLEQALQHTE